MWMSSKAHIQITDVFYLLTLSIGLTLACRLVK